MKGCRPLTDSELDQITMAFQGEFALRNRCAFELGVSTGLRASELLSLTVGHVLRNGQIQREIEVARRNTKGKHEGRLVYVTMRCLPVLDAYLKSLGNVHPSTPLFPSQKGDGTKPLTYDAMHGILRTVVVKIGIDGKVSTHSQRKTFAQAVYQALDYDIISTQTALGHASFVNTVKYLLGNTPKIRKTCLELFSKKAG